MMNKSFGLLGEKLSHSLSPQIHSLIGDYEYKLYPTGKSELDSFFENNSLDGFNVTIPYKIEAMKRCSKLSEEAEKTGSVNTVVRLEDGTYYGDNTDIFGFECAARRCGCDFSGKKVLILGSGGASRTANYVAGKKGASEIITVSRTGENNYGNISRHYDADVIVNTTPVGMFPDNGKSVIDLNNFKKCKKVIDLIYNPLRTPLLQQAESLGKDCINGLYMLAAQAVRSASVFLNENIPDSKAEEIYKTVCRNQRNITLIGMPGCGKTTLGKLLAEKFGREFADTDEAVEALGESIPEIFGKYGEAEFRSRESEAIGKICKGGGKVIATGGGAVINPSNRISIRENSLVIYLDAPLEILEKSGRPLSESAGAVENLYLQRAALYEECADFKITVSRNTEENLRRLSECVYL